jgi:hypothetical protein
MAAPKGTMPPNAGRGRPRGSRNKITSTIKEALEASFDAIGGAEWLAQQAHQNSSAYLHLLGRLLPSELRAEIQGAGVPGLADAVEAARARVAAARAKLASQHPVSSDTRIDNA